MLESLLRHYRGLRDQYGMQSVSMGSFAEPATAQAPTSKAWR
jgi:hypothetical protein